MPFDGLSQNRHVSLLAKNESMKIPSDDEKYAADDLFVTDEWFVPCIQEETRSLQYVELLLLSLYPKCRDRDVESSSPNTFLLDVRPGTA